MNPVEYAGTVSDDQQIIGTCLHGIFDNNSICETFLNRAALKHSMQFNYKELR